MFKQLQIDIVEAMKNKNKERLTSLRLIKDEMQKRYLHEEITNDKFQNTIKSLIKQMKKSLQIKEDIHNRHLLNTCLQYKEEEKQIDTKEIEEFIKTNNFNNIGDFMNTIKNSKFEDIDKKFLVNIFNKVNKK